MDEARFDDDPTGTRAVLPFMERNGVYWGCPPDDNTAISEFERLIKQGATHIVFGWMCFWWIEYYSGHEPFITNEDIEGYNATSRLFSTRNLVTAKDLLEKNQISYIFITDEMRDGLVWKRENEGLLFLLGNEEEFKNVYNRSGYEIWKVIT